MAEIVSLADRPDSSNWLELEREYRIRHADRRQRIVDALIRLNHRLGREWPKYSEAFEAEWGNAKQLQITAYADSLMHRRSEDHVMAALEAWPERSSEWPTAFELHEMIDEISRAAD